MTAIDPRLHCPPGSPDYLQCLRRLQLLGLLQPGLAQSGLFDNPTQLSLNLSNDGPAPNLGGSVLSGGLFNAGAVPGQSQEASAPSGLPGFVGPVQVPVNDPGFQDADFDPFQPTPLPLAQGNPLTSPLGGDAQTPLDPTALRADAALSDSPLARELLLRRLRGMESRFAAAAARRASAPQSFAAKTGPPTKGG